MFSAVNSPTPRVLFGMVVSGGGGVRLLGVGGCAQSGAVDLSRPMGPWGSKKGGSIEPPFVGCSCPGVVRSRLVLPTHVRAVFRRVGHPEYRLLGQALCSTLRKIYRKQRM